MQPPLPRVHPPNTFSPQSPRFPSTRTIDRPQQCLGPAEAAQSSGLEAVKALLVLSAGTENQRLPRGSRWVCSLGNRQIKVAFLPWDSDIRKLERRGKRPVIFGISHHVLYRETFLKRQLSTGMFLCKMGLIQQRVSIGHSCRSFQGNWEKETAHLPDLKHHQGLQAFDSVAAGRSMESRSRVVRQE